jgi:hypothetical protein
MYESQDSLRIFKILMILGTGLVVFAIIAAIFSDAKFSWEFPKSGLIPFAIISFFIFRVLKIKISNLYQHSILAFYAYTNRISTYENWLASQKKMNIILENYMIEYYQELRENFDQETIDRIISHKFVKGEQVDVVLYSLGLPHFFEFNKDVVETIEIFYFPYYSRKNIINFFNFKFKFSLKFISGELSKLKIDGKLVELEKIPKIQS